MLFYAYGRGPKSPAATAVVTIPRGSSVSEIGRLLGEAQLIRYDRRFVPLTRLLGVSSRLPAGEFLLHSGQRAIDLLKELSQAHPLEHSVTIPEGLNISEIAAIFSRQGWANEGRLIELAHDPAFFSQFELGEIPSLEGYLYPDTYQLIRPPPTEEELLRRLVLRALEVWREVVGQHEAGRHETFTLASMIEKETAAPEERPIISAVFHNRLFRHMRLQSDPTVIYGLDDFDGRLTRSQLKNPSPFNTYLIPALPPGPICSPGRQALQAAVQPADVEFLYFVSKNDGTHQFSISLKQHNQAVRRYQRRDSDDSGSDPSD